MKVMSINITVELPDNVQLPDEKIKVNVNPQARVAPARKKATLIKRWKKKEEEFLIENYKKMTYAEIAEKLGRNEQQVSNKAFWLRRQGKINPKINHKKHRGRPPKHLGKISDNGNGLTCADCPKAEKESGGTVYCTIYGVRKKADTPMCQEIADSLNEVRP